MFLFSFHFFILLIPSCTKKIITHSISFLVTHDETTFIPILIYVSPQPPKFYTKTRIQGTNTMRDDPGITFFYLKKNPLLIYLLCVYFRVENRFTTRASQSFREQLMHQCVSGCKNESYQTHAYKCCENISNERIFIIKE